MDTDIQKIILENGGEIAEGEVFKQCKGYSRYYISNKGRVFSTYNNMFLSTNAIDGKLINGKRNGYHFVRILNDNGKTDCRYLHRLIADNFLDNPQGFRDVHHINGCKYDNRLENLRFCSRKENTIIAVGIKLDVYHIESERTYRFNSIVEAADNLYIDYKKLYAHLRTGKQLCGFVFSRTQEAA